MHLHIFLGTGHIDKTDAFYYSIYRPDPSHEMEYNRYKKEIQLSYHKMEDKIGLICLTNCIVHSHYHVIDDIIQIGYRSHIKLSKENNESIIQILHDISNIIIPNEFVDENELVDKKKKAIKKIIDDKFRFITKGDNNEEEITNIFMDAYIYVSDKKYETETVRRDMLIELYERGIVEPDSKLSHNLMRNAAESGVLWIVKYLIEKGCPTKNLPEHGIWKHDLESKQLKDILEEKVKDHGGLGQKWVDKTTKARLDVYLYLTKNGYI